MDDVQSGVTDQGQMGVIPEAPAAVVPEVTEGVADQTTDQQSLSPDGGTEESKNTWDTEKQGLVSTIEAERDRRQTEASARQLAEDKARLLEQQLQQYQAQSREQDPLESLADDEYISGAKLKETLGSYSKRMNEQMQVYKVQLTAEKARSKYGAEYDRAIDLFDKFATPTEKYIVLTSPDPGERAYRYGASVPEFQKEATKKAVQSVADTVNKHTGNQKTLSAVGGGGLSEKDEVRRITEMTDEEFDKMYNKVKYGGL